MKPFLFRHASSSFRMARVWPAIWPSPSTRKLRPQLVSLADFRVRLTIGDCTAEQKLQQVL